MVIRRIFKYAVAFSILLVLFLGVQFGMRVASLGFFGAIFMPSDEQLVNRFFPSDLPGYKKIEILTQEGKGLSWQDIRLLTIRATLDIAPEPATCQGQIYYFMGDPGLSGVHWFSLDCMGQTGLIGRANSYILYKEQGVLPWCPDDNSAILLKYWLDKKKIRLDAIQNPIMRNRVKDLIDGTGSPFGAGATGTSLFGPSKTGIKDLAPELPEDRKVTYYVLRCDGTLDLVLLKSNSQPFELGIGDAVLTPPLTPPALNR